MLDDPPFRDPLAPTEADMIMSAKVSLLKQAFGLGTEHAFQLLQSAGANCDIAYDAYLEAGDRLNYGRYGVAATATELMSRLIEAKAIAKTKAIEARDAEFRARR